MSTVHFKSESCEWETPQDLFDFLNKRFSFTLDPCATSDNSKCERYYTKEQDGLAKDWVGECVFMNPPYGREISKWCAKAVQSAKEGTLIVGLIPARTDTKWWDKYVRMDAEVFFIRGRLKFGGCKNSAPFPSAIAIWWK